VTSREPSRREILSPKSGRLEPLPNRRGLVWNFPEQPTRNTGRVAATHSTAVEWTRNAGACVTPFISQSGLPQLFSTSGVDSRDEASRASAWCRRPAVGLVDKTIDHVLTVPASEGVPRGSDASRAERLHRGCFKTFHAPGSFITRRRSWQALAALSTLYPHDPRAPRPLRRAYNDELQLVFNREANGLLSPSTLSLVGGSRVRWPTVHSTPALFSPQGTRPR
jgi:hypothetical protein